MAKSLHLCVTSLSVSSKVPSSSRNSMSSRPDILPSLCCFSRRLAPPPSSARWSRFLSSSSFCSRFIVGDYRRGEEKKDQAEEDLGTLSRTAPVGLQRPCIPRDLFEAVC